MNATVIDTLRYANRLKDAGVESVQAEAMSRALNDELTEGLVTKADLADAVSELGARIDALDAKFEIRFVEMEARFAVQDGKFDAIDARFDAIEGKFDAIEGKFEAIDGKFAAVDARFDAVLTQVDALRSQGRYVFLVLALIAGLGLYNAAVPHLLGTIGRPGSASAAEMPREEPTTVTAWSDWATVSP